MTAPNRAERPYPVCVDALRERMRNISARLLANLVGEWLLEIETSCAEHGIEVDTALAAPMVSDLPADQWLRSSLDIPHGIGLAIGVDDTHELLVLCGYREEKAS